jgi:hypothetical protein
MRSFSGVRGAPGFHVQTLPPKTGAKPMTAKRK